MKILDGIFVGIKDKEIIQNQINALCEKYNARQAPDYTQKRLLLRSFCVDTLAFFNDCFETSLLGMKRCIKRVKDYQTKDIVDIDLAVRDIIEILWQLKSVVNAMIPIKDMPSCKKLTELSPEDIIAKAKDLVESDIVKAAVGGILVGKKVNDVVQIEDVKRFYTDRLTQLNCEIQEKRESASPIEQFLLDKFNAEIGYCNLALYKAGLGITEELMGLVDVGMRSIEKYEERMKGEGEMRLCCG